jgi:hypothetical protein
MSAKEIVEAGLMVGGVVLGTAGAVLLEPVVIGAGALAAGAVVVLRFTDQRARQSS